jgi:GxxExxY protein
MKITKRLINELTYEIIGAAIEVHKELGPGLLEQVYEQCLIHELKLRGLKVASQQPIQLKYKDVELETRLSFDLKVEDLIIVECKSVAEEKPIFDAVLMSYMKLMKKPKGILINFNCLNIFSEGQKTFVNELYAALPD